MKAKYTFILVLLVGLILSCNPYKRVSITGSDFYGRNKVIKNIDRYDVYVHQNNDTYKLTETKSVDSAQISGQIIPISAKDSLVNQSTDKVLTEERNDIHIYVNNDFEEKLQEPNQTISIKTDDIKEVKLVAKEKMGAVGLVLTIVLGVLGTMLLLFAFILGIIITSNDESTSQSGNSDSGDSGSGDSGSGDSGGSNSDSGCYVATMAYGSYNAPQVMVLRHFRDRFLQKFGLGRAFIQWYYKNSPGFVQKHQSKLWLHAILRQVLNLVVWLLKPFFG